MENLTYLQIKNVVKNEYGWDQDEANSFMCWLEKQEGIDLNSSDPDYGLQSEAQIERFMTIFERRALLLGNAFSLNMIQGNKTLKTRVLDVEYVQHLFSFRPVVSAVGHPTTAAIFSTILGEEIPSNRATVRLEAGDDIIIGQYKGPRLEEGSTTLPEGACIEWVLVTVQ